MTKPERYSPGAKVIVDGVTCVYCVHCREVKKGEDAGLEQCRVSCELCYKRFGCECRHQCVVGKGQKPSVLRDYVAASRIMEVLVPLRRSESLYAVPSDAESDGEYKDAAGDTYDAYYYADLDDDDWRAFS